MYAGRNADDTDDDMIFYGMNAYWEPLEMRLPSLPESYHWKLVVNTFCEYQDGAVLKPRHREIRHVCVFRNVLR